MEEQTSPASDLRGIVFNIMRFSVHDGPGIRTTVFLKGCPLRCAWCHNPESQSFHPEVMYSAARCVHCGDCIAACPNHALAWSSESGPVRDRDRCENCGTCAGACPTAARQVVGRQMTVAELMREIRKDAIFFDESGGGVTFSGGEPLAQPDFLAAALDACAQEGIHRVVDTSGFAPTDVLRRIAPNVSLFLFDLKTLDDARHRQFVGSSNELVLKNLKTLVALGSKLIVRIPIIPTVNDDIKQIRAAVEFLADLGLREFSLLPYHSLGDDKYSRLSLEQPKQTFSAPTLSDIQSIADRFRSHGFAVHIGG